MKLVNQRCEPIIQYLNGANTHEELLNGIYKQIERAGRTCYKSEDKITDGSAKGFVERMVASKHYAMLEHGTVYLFINAPRKAWHHDLELKYINNPYSRVVQTSDDYEDFYYITTNYRVIIENGWEKDLQYLCSPTKHIRRTTFHFVCNRQVSHEFVRHKLLCVAYL